jgi:hypothetical protein
MAAILLEVKEAMAFLLEGIDLHKCWTPEAPEAASTSDDEEFLQNEIEFPCLCAELDYGQNGFDDYPSRMGWTVKRNAKNPLRRTNSASYSVGDAGSSCRLGFSSVRFLDPFDGAALETGYRILVQSHSAKITSAVDGKELGNNRRKITLKYAAKASYTGSSKRRKIHRDCAGDCRSARCGAPVAPQSLIISSSGHDATSLPSDEKTTSRPSPDGPWAAYRAARPCRRVPEPNRLAARARHDQRVAREDKKEAKKAKKATKAEESEERD